MSSDDEREEVSRELSRIRDGVRERALLEEHSATLPRGRDAVPPAAVPPPEAVTTPPQEELVAHVHDLVKRTDLVLAEAERGRLSLTFQLRDLRTRLERLEERLRRE